MRARVDPTARRRLTGALLAAAAVAALACGSAGAVVSVGEPGVPPAPGSLPQTRQRPSSASSQFRALMADLWAGVVANLVGRAMPAFLPRAAYRQLARGGDSRGDWSDRLVHDYRLDIAAAHALLGAGAAHAQMLDVSVVTRHGHWVAPGACHNRVGYDAMPNARVVYREAGRTRSFGIASMVAWRDEWYVVDLGAITRSTDTGVVDAPAAGRGTSPYSRPC